MQKGRFTSIFDFNFNSSTAQAGESVIQSLADWDWIIITKAVLPSRSERPPSEDTYLPERYLCVLLSDKQTRYI